MNNQIISIKDIICSTKVGPWFVMIILKNIFGKGHIILDSKVLFGRVFTLEYIFGIK